MRMVDQNAVDAAFKDIKTYLGRIDPADRKRAWWLKWTGLNVMNVLIVMSGFVIWLVWSGHI
jgi:cytochrome c1